jgi:RNA recognition motif-containing protein
LRTDLIRTIAFGLLPGFTKRRTLMSVKLVVGNLSPDTTSDELLALIAGIDGIEWCHLITERETGRSKGYAFIKLVSSVAANIVREKLSGRDLRGRKLILQEIGLKLDRAEDGGHGGTRVLTVGPR